MVVVANDGTLVNLDTFKQAKRFPSIRKRSFTCPPPYWGDTMCWTFLTHRMYWQLCNKFCGMAKINAQFGLDLFPLARGPVHEFSSSLMSSPIFTLKSPEMINTCAYRNVQF